MNVEEIRNWHETHPDEPLDLLGANLVGAYLAGANLLRANLVGANLRGAYLVGANLVGANLCHVNLRDANLVGANLVGADLHDANLHHANLRGAYLYNVKGLFLLNIYDPRGYRPYAQIRDGDILIGSGCWVFTLANAKEHWGEAYEGDRFIGDRYLEGLRQLDSPEFQAWLELEKAQAEAKDA